MKPLSIKNTFIIAWIFGCLFYFLEYVARSAPAVMIAQLSAFFGITTLGVSTVLGTYYYTYSVTSLIAGIAFDRAGGKYPIALGTAILCIGCLLFAVPDVFAGNVGRLLQGAGSAFAFTGCVYLASNGFAPKYIATAIGLTQCVGMLGGSAGQFVVGPMFQNGLLVQEFWMYLGIACGVTAVLLFIITPSKDKTLVETTIVPIKKGNLLTPYKIVFTNTQSYFSGIISGLLFAPTTIFAMTWGVAFFQQDRHLEYAQAVLLCSLVPLGWVIGCPLLGWISDRMGRRKPVLIGGIILMLISFSQLVYVPSLIPSWITMLVFGIASGAAMIPYSIIKEANPDKVKGSATGGINFLTFGITAIIGPVYAALFGKVQTTDMDYEAHFRNAGAFLLLTTFVALIVSCIIKETGNRISK